MTSAAEVLRAGGLDHADQIVLAADWEGLDLAYAATLIEIESRGRHVWGHDPVPTGGVYVKGGPVTRANYLAYRAALRAGAIGRQGCGPAQCTSAEYQDQADQLGGCWDVVANMRSGFRGLKWRIDRYGEQQGFRRYNGAGQAAEAYALKAMARLAVWRSRLAAVTAQPTPPALSPSPPEEDEDTMHVPIRVDEVGEFRESFCAESGGGGWFARGIVTFGTAWGWTEVAITGLSARGEIANLLGSPAEPFRIPNNTSVVVELPDATRHVTVEGRVEHAPGPDNDPGTRPWAAWLAQRS